MSGFLAMPVYRFLADLVVVLHAAYVAVVVFALVAIVLGTVLRWRWVRNFWFRSIHFLMIAVVVAQSLLGVICPLTTLENRLRRTAGETVYDGSFIGHWAHELLFMDTPDWVFTLCYCLFGAVVLACFWLCPPRWPWSRSVPSSENAVRTDIHT